MGFMAVVALGVFSLATAAFAHGTGVRTSPDRPLAMEFYYSTDEPMAYAEAKVYSPADAKFAYQEGMTDDNGRFAFVPNVDGEWRVVVLQEGHRAEAKVNVVMAELNSNDGSAPAGPAVTGSSMPQGMELAKNALLGVSLLFNIGCAIMVVRRRRA